MSNNPIGKLRRSRKGFNFLIVFIIVIIGEKFSMLKRNL